MNIFIHVYIELFDRWQSSEVTSMINKMAPRPKYTRHALTYNRAHVCKFYILDFCCMDLRFDMVKKQYKILSKIDKHQFDN